MPNWCMNEITVTGSQTEMARLAEMASQGRLLEALVPIPDSIDSDSEDGHFWRLNNWGVKWDMDEDEGEAFRLFNHKDGTATLTGFYSTPWGPPIEALLTYANNNPGVSINNNYFEAGMMFGGTFNNELGQAEYPDISMTDIPSELDEAFNLSEMFDEWAQMD